MNFASDSTARRTSLLPCGGRRKVQTAGEIGPADFADEVRVAVGSRADFVAVDVNSVRTAGGGATVENVVFGANASDVTDVVVDGRTLVAGRRHLTVPDPASELASAISDLMDTPS
jgi:cytosine/adenosine deaminase-related metal-dependent hydrolase